MYRSTPKTDNHGAAETAHPPLASVIMPCYNTARYIAEAIDSVLSQDYPNKELIVIDDGSTDGTLDIIRGYGDQIILLNQQNQGSGAARNAGLDIARGEYIAFLDSDDLWLPDKLSTQIAYMQEHPGIGMTYSRWQVWKPNPDGEFQLPEIAMRTGTTPAMRTEIVPDGSGWLYNQLLFSSLLHTITVMARREHINTVGKFDTSLKRGQDYDYWLRSSRVTPIHQLDQVLALYRVHGEGCIKKWPYVNYEMIIMKKTLSRWGRTGPDGETTKRKDLIVRLADSWFNFGYYHYWEASTWIALKSFSISFIYNPLRVATWRYILMSIAKITVSPFKPALRIISQ